MTNSQIIKELELIETSAKLLQERSYTIRMNLLRVDGAAPSGVNRKTNKQIELITDLRRRLIKKPVATGSDK